MADLLELGSRHHFCGANPPLEGTTMAAATWALTPETKKKIAEIATDLNAEIEELRGTFDEKPESWQEGDRGTDVSAWLDGLDDLTTTLENVEESA